MIEYNSFIKFLFFLISLLSFLFITSSTFYYAVIISAFLCEENLLFFTVFLHEHFKIRMKNGKIEASEKKGDI